MKPTLTIIDFWAAWCGPCKALSPILDQLAEKYPHIDLQKIDVEDEANEPLQLQYNVVGLPTVLALIDGTIVKRITGAKPLPAIEQDLREWL